MKIRFLLAISFLPLLILAQDEKGGKLNRGLNFKLNSINSYWKQSSLNEVLSSNNTLTVRNNSIGIGYDVDLRLINFIVNSASSFMMNSNRKFGSELGQTFAYFDLNLKYYLYNSPSDRCHIYPLAGIGEMSGTTNIIQTQPPSSFNSLFTNRNAIRITNSHTYINTGIGIDFTNPAKSKSKMLALFLGYRYGLDNNKWSTSWNNDDINGAPSDKLQQLYFTLSLGLSRNWEKGKFRKQSR
jgi:hypothetical protein